MCVCVKKNLAMKCNRKKNPTCLTGTKKNTHKKIAQPSPQKFNGPSLTTKRCKTTTYQKSYLNRVTRLWNILPRDLTGKNISLTQFALFNYYKLAVKNIYDVHDPRTWKSICLSCNKCRNLSCYISCCY